MFCCDFLYFLLVVLDWGSTKTPLFSEFQNHKDVGCLERYETPKYELCKGREEVGGLIGRGVFIRINTVTDFN